MPDGNVIIHHFHSTLCRALRLPPLWASVCVASTHMHVFVGHRSRDTHKRVHPFSELFRHFFLVTLIPPFISFHFQCVLVLLGQRWSAPPCGWELVSASSPPVFTERAEPHRLTGLAWCSALQTAPFLRKEAQTRCDQNSLCLTDFLWRTTVTAASCSFPLEVE